MSWINQKQLQKRAVNPGVPTYSGGLKLVGLEASGYDANLWPSFKAIVAAGGNSVQLNVTSGNEASFELLKFYVSDSSGNKVQAVYTGAPVVLDTTSISKDFSTVRPGVKIGIMYKEVNGGSLGETRTLSYEVPMDSGTFAAGITVDTADYLKSDVAGAQILNLDAVYDATPAAEKIDITAKAISCIGLDFEVFENLVSLGTGTVDADGNIVFSDAGVRAPGSYTYKVEITSAGAADGSYNDVTITV